MDYEKLNAKLAKMPFFLRAVKSIKTELGNSLNKHATIQNLSRHLPKHQRHQCKEAVWLLFRAGVLRNHRTDTFCWTPHGLEWANSLKVNE